MQRTPVNPRSWSLAYGYNQAELIQGATRHIVCAGQTAVDANDAPQHSGDMHEQLTLAQDNLQTVPQAVDIGLAHITRLTIYTTDVDQALQHFDILGAAIGPIGASPPMTLLGVTRLVIAPLMIELKATAS